jgi:hypothetical protein
LRTIIAGSRTIQDYSICLRAVEASGFEITRILSGHAKGVDRMGESYAYFKKIPCDLYPANWAKYGRSAGVIRNKEMADTAEALIAIWDGESRGTLNMIEIAKKKGLKVFVYNLQDVK